MKEYEEFAWGIILSDKFANPERERRASDDAIETVRSARRSRSGFADNV